MKFKNKIEEYIEKKPLRFHMPSHFGLSNNKYLKEVFKIDITELSFSDNTQIRKGIIKNLEKQLSKIYLSFDSLISTSGATQSIFIALHAISKRVDKIYYIGNPHKSFFSGCELFNIKNQEFIDYNENVKCVFLTSPDYFGNLEKNIKYFEKLFDEKKIYLIIDESHGAHFPFINIFQKATFKIDSMHKTLPVFTSTACLNIYDKDLIKDSVISRNLINTTSPSYSFYYAVSEFIEEYRYKYKTIYKSIKKTRDLYFKNYKNNYLKVVETDDFCKLVLKAKSLNLAKEIEKYLEDNNIFIEARIDKFLILIIGKNNICNLNELRKKIDNFNGYNVKSVKIKENIRNLIGKIAEQNIGIYPPGQVIIKKGEIIKEEDIEILVKEPDKIYGLD